MDAHAAGDGRDYRGVGAVARAAAAGAARAHCCLGVAGEFVVIGLLLLFYREA